MQRTNRITLLTVLISIAIWVFLYYTNPVVGIIIGSIVVAFVFIYLMFLIIKYYQ